MLLGSGATVDTSGHSLSEGRIQAQWALRAHGGRSTGPRTQRGLQRISEANLKHGRQTKDKLAAQRHAAEVGSRDMGELKRIEGQIVDAGLMPNDSGRLSRYRP